MDPRNIIGKTALALDQGWVKLVDTMGSDKEIVERARKTQRGISTGETISLEGQRRMLRALLLNQPPHTNPFERAEMVFDMRIPVVALYHLSRHRTFRFWSLSVQSGRLSTYKPEGFHYPTQWRAQNEKRKSLNPEETKDLLTRLAAQYKSGYENYLFALSLGVAREQARLFLNMFAVYVELEAKVDLLNLMHFMRLRLDPLAQEEIRRYAEAIYKLFAEAFPLSTAAFDAQIENDQRGSLI